MDLLWVIKTLSNLVIMYMYVIGMEFVKLVLLKLENRRTTGTKTNGYFTKRVEDGATMP